MRARKKLDIGWRDLAFGLAASLRVTGREAVERRIAERWAGPGTAVATLSVRSGLDLLLQCLDLPRGSEIAMSAITIPDMVAIIEHHGMRAVPVDIDVASGALRPGLLEQAVTPRTRAVLVAHLFGGRMPLDEVLAVARRHGLLVIEDCAQALDGASWGDAASDVRMFSFGPIKTATALGGAVLAFRDAPLAGAVSRRQQALPLQPQWRFAQRVVKYAALKALSLRAPYALFVHACRLCGASHDRVIGRALRGFAGGELVRKIRHRPSLAQLALLERRLHRFRAAHLEARIRAASLAAAALPPDRLVGAAAPAHTHWVFPVLSREPDRLVRYLWERGFDATRGASNLYAVPAPPGQREPVHARDAMRQMLFLPVETAATPARVRALVAAVLRFESGNSGPVPEFGLSEGARNTGTG